MQLLDCLRHDMSRGVPQDVQSVRAVDRDGLDLVIGEQLASEVPELAVDLGGDDRRVVREQFPRLGGSHLHSIVTAAPTAGSHC